MRLVLLMAIAGLLLWQVTLLDRLADATCRPAAVELVRP